MKKHILIIEDDFDLSDTLQTTLQAEGYTTALASNQQETDHQIETTPPDLILLDIDLNLPDLNGLDLCQHLRNTLSTPILMLTGSEDDFDKVIALELGANNYLTKPINPRVLLSFIKRTLKLEQERASQRSSSGKALHIKSTYLLFSDYIINLDRQTVTSEDGKAIDITPVEFKFLSILAQNPRRVLSREQLLNLTERGEIYERSIDKFISRLRKKLEKDPSNPTIIKSIRGSGYVFDTDVIKKQE